MENENYLKLQQAHHDLQQMQEHLQILERQQTELSFMDHSLGEFKGVKPGSEILVQLASGIFARAEVKSIEPLLVNVGAGVVVEKNLEETKRILKDQVADLQRVSLDMQQKFMSLVAEFQKLQEAKNV